MAKNTIKRCITYMPDGLYNRLAAKLRREKPKAVSVSAFYRASARNYLRS